MNKIRLYVIGAGAIGRFMCKSIPLFPGQPVVELSFSDPTPASQEAAKAEYPDARIFSSVDEMLAEPALPTDIVMISTPPQVRHSLAMKALASGRNVLCEKPFMMTVAEAREVVAEAKKRKLLVGCASSRFQQLPTNLKVKSLIEDGTLGELYHIHFVHKHPRHRSGIEWQPGSRWFLDKSKNGGGVGMDWANYDFSVFTYMLEPVKVEILTCLMKQPETWVDFGPEIINNVEQHIIASIRFTRKNGEEVLLTYERSGCIHDQEEIFAQAHGTKGGARWDWWFNTNRQVTVYGDEMGKLKTINIEYMPEDADPAAMFAPVVFYKAVTGDPNANAVLNDRALLNFACVRALYDCAQTGKPQTIEFGV